MGPRWTLLSLFSYFQTTIQRINLSLRQDSNTDRQSDGKHANHQTTIAARTIFFSKQIMTLTPELDTQLQKDVM